MDIDEVEKLVVDDLRKLDRNYDHLDMFKTMNCKNPITEALNILGLQRVEIKSLQSELTKVKEEKDKIKKTLNSTYSILLNAIELNMGNYTEDEVESLNNSMIEAFTVIANWESNK